jgi:hypothetical protein
VAEVHDFSDHRSPGTVGYSQQLENPSSFLVDTAVFLQMPISITGSEMVFSLLGETLVSDPQPWVLGIKKDLSGLVRDLVGWVHQLGGVHSQGSFDLWKFAPDVRSTLSNKGPIDNPYFFGASVILILSFHPGWKVLGGPFSSCCILAKIFGSGTPPELCQDTLTKVVCSACPHYLDSNLVLWQASKEGKNTMGLSPHEQKAHAGLFFVSAQYCLWTSPLVVILWSELQL